MWNKIASFMIIAVASSLLLTPIELEARRGGGGGGRGGGGGGRGAGGGGGRSASAAKAKGSTYRGGNTINRTPTMSRASPARSNALQARQQRQASPSALQGRVQQSRQAVSQRPSTANRAQVRSQVSQYAQNRPAVSRQNIDRQALAQRTQKFSTNRNTQLAQNRQLSQRVSQRLQQSRPDSGRWFNQGFFDRHNIDVGYAGSRANWWRPAAWSSLAAWGAWGWSDPYYYDDDGYGYPLTPDQYDNNYTYNVNVESPQDLQSTQSLVASPSATSLAPEDDNWLPLGVFAVASNANTAVYANHFIQLAINRSGEIAGVVYNSTTDTTQEVTGMVDPTSQVAYWSLADRANSPIASTGIYNLTQDETSLHVHFADGSDQTWALVRLQQGQ